MNAGRLGRSEGQGRGDRQATPPARRGKLTNNHGLHPGDFQSPRPDVGSCSYVGATVGNIGLRFDPIPSCDLQATGGEMLAFRTYRVRADAGPGGDITII